MQHRGTNGGEKKQHVVYLDKSKQFGFNVFLSTELGYLSCQGGIETARLGMQSKQMDKHAEGGEAAKILKDHPWLDEKDWTYSDR